MKWRGPWGAQPRLQSTCAPKETEVRSEAGVRTPLQHPQHTQLDGVPLSSEPCMAPGTHGIEAQAPIGGGQAPSPTDLWHKSDSQPHSNPRVSNSRRRARAPTPDKARGPLKQTRPVSSCPERLAPLILALALPRTRQWSRAKLCVTPGKLLELSGRHFPRLGDSTWGLQRQHLQAQAHEGMGVAAPQTCVTVFI